MPTPRSDDYHAIGAQRWSAIRGMIGSRSIGRCAVVVAVALVSAPSALASAASAPSHAARTITKAEHNACERRAARAHRRPHCPHTTPQTATRPTNPSDPYAGYHAPTGSLLTPAAATAKAVAFANPFGDPAPTVTSVTLSTRGQQQLGGPPPGSLDSPGYQAYLASQVYVVSMQGHFTENNAQLANGSSPPSGTGLQVLVDAHTGQITSTTLVPG